MTQDEIKLLIVAKAKEAGIDPNHALAMASIESGFNPRAVSPSGQHKGIFQLGGPEWAKHGGSGDPFDPSANVAAYISYQKEIKDQMTHFLGAEPTSAELYLGWQQGAKGAALLINNPKTSASAIVGNSAVTGNAGAPGVSAEDFANQWRAKYAEHLAQVGGTAVAAATPSLNAGLLVPSTPIDTSAASAAVEQARQDKEREQAFAELTKTGMGLLGKATTAPVQFASMGGGDDVTVPKPNPPPLPNYRQPAQGDDEFMKMLMQQRLQRRV